MKLDKEGSEAGRHSTERLRASFPRNEGICKSYEVGLLVRKEELALKILELEVMVKIGYTMAMGCWKHEELKITGIEEITEFWYFLNV